MMAGKADTRVRFLGAYAARKDLLGVLAYPVTLDEQEAEFTRFYTTNFQRWAQKAFEFDVVSIGYGESSQGLAFWLLGKRGQVIVTSPSGQTTEQIRDAGTGPGKLGYVNSLRIIGNRVFVCGYQRQIYERVKGSWVHIDDGVLADESVEGVSLNDIEGNASGALCAVGAEGEIAVADGSRWSLLDSPTNAHLYALCVDGEGRFCAAGANATVVRGDGAAFEVLCAGQPAIGSLWDIAWFGEQLVVSATAGLFVVRAGTLAPFDPPLPRKPVGYKLASCNGRLWFVGTHKIFCLEGKKWEEWRCPDNAP
jgi:hypothetical protein